MEAVADMERLPALGWLPSVEPPGDIRWREGPRGGPVSIRDVWTTGSGRCDRGGVDG